MTTTPSILHYESSSFAVSANTGTTGARATIRNLTLSPHGWDKPATTTLEGEPALALIAQIDEALMKHYDPSDVEASEARGMKYIDTTILTPLDARLRADLEEQRLTVVKNTARLWIVEGVRQGSVALIDAVDRLHGGSAHVHTFLPAVDELQVRDYMENALRRDDARPPLRINDVRIVPVSSLFYGCERPVKSWTDLIEQHESLAYERGVDVDFLRLDLFLGRDARLGYNLWGQFHTIAQAAGVTVRNAVFDRFDARANAGTTVFSVQPAGDEHGYFELLLHKNGKVYTSHVTYSSEAYAVKTALEFEHKFVTPHAQYGHDGLGRRPKDDVLKVESLVKSWLEKSPATVITRVGQRPGTTSGQEAAELLGLDAAPLPTIRLRP